MCVRMYSQDRLHCYQPCDSITRLKLNQQHNMPDNQSILCC